MDDAMLVVYLRDVSDLSNHSDAWGSWLQPGRTSEVRFAFKVS